jgi:hypothetical protein
MSADRSRPGRWRSGPRLDALVSAALAILALLLLLPDMVRGAVATGDGWVQNFPMKVLAAERLRSLELPAWSSAPFSGSPLYAVGHFGVLYPPNLLLVVLPTVLAYNLGLVSSLAISAIGCYLLGRAVLRDRLAALLLALAVGLGPFRWAELGHPELLSSVAWLPWALLGIEVARRPGRRFRGMLLLAGSVALCTLAGHPQMLAAVLMAAVGWAVCRAVSDRTDRLVPLGTAAAGIAAGLGLAAVQLIPTLAIVSSTGRGSYSYAEASSYSFSGTQLVYGLFPFLSGGGAFGGEAATPVAVGSYPYLGAVVLVLAFGAVPAWRRTRWILPAAIVSLLVIAAAVSPVLDLLGRVTYLLPPFGRFRIWNRYWVVPELLVGLLAGHTVATLRRGTAGERRAALRWCGIGAGAYVLAALAALVAPGIGSRSLAGALVPTLLAVGAVAAVVIGARRDRTGLGVGVAVGLAIVDLMVLGRLGSAQSVVDPSEVARAMDDRRAVDFVSPAEGGVSRFLTVGVSGEDVPTVHPRAPLAGLSGARGVTGYDPLAQQRYLDALGMDYYGGIADPTCLLTQPGGHAVLDLLRVSTVFTPDASPVAADAAALGTVRPSAFDGWARVDRTPDRGDAWLAPSDVARSPVADLACTDLTLPAPVGTATASRPDEETIRARTDADAPSVLVISEAYADGWQATVDGRQVAVVRPYGVTLGVPVPAGEHDVVLEYRVPGLRLGALVSVLTAIGLVITGLVVRRRRRATPAGSTGA